MTKAILSLLVLGAVVGWAQQNVGIGTNTPDPSALLHLESTSKGLLIPRMTQAQRNAISSPATGLIIYQTDNNPGFYYYNGASWIPLLTGTSGSGLFWSLTGNSGTTPWNGTTGNFVGTTDGQKLVIATTNSSSPQPIEFWVGNQPTLILSPPGNAAPAWSIYRGGGNPRGAGAVDLQVLRLANSQVASGDLSVIGGGGANTASGYISTVSGGAGNTASGSYSTVGGGNENVASGDYSTVGGGYSNQASGSRSVVSGGAANVAGGDYSAIPGGNSLRIGNRSFGFSGQTSATPTDLSAYSNIAAFVDVDLWLYNVRNQASQLRLYEPSGSGTNYTAFRAQAQASDIVYTLPGSLTPVTTVGAGLLQTDASGNLSWVSPSAVVSSSAWSLTGNGGTNPSMHFLGTTDNQPLVIRTNNTERVRITETGTVGIGTVPNLGARLESQTLNASGAVEAVFGKGGSGVSLMSGWPTVGFNAYYDYSGSQWRSLSAGWTGNISVDQSSGIMRFELPSAAVGGANQPVTHTIRMAITPTGRVGIGTLTPAQALHVEGSAYIAAQLGIGISSPTHALQVSGNSALFSSSGDVRVLISKNSTANIGSLLFQTNFSGRAELGLLAGSDNFSLRVSPDGSSWTDALTVDRTTAFVGIGTTSPSHRLHVVATADPLRLQGLQSDNTLDQVLVVNSAGVVKTRSASTLLAASAWSLTGNSGTNPSTHFLGTTDNQPLVIRTNNTERMRITASGNVGIGTSNPAARLDVEGNATATNLLLVSNDVDATKDSTLVFSSNGRLGIGTTSPSNALHVVATSNPLRLQGLQSDNTQTDILVVDNNGVVKKRSLSSLTGIATYIRKTSNQTVTNSTTYQNDNALVYTASANEIFEFEAHMFISGGNGGIKIRVSIPSGASMKLYAELKKDNQHNWVYTKLTSSTDEVSWNKIDSTYGYARIVGIVQMGSSGGNVQVQWAQYSSDATGTTVEAGSYLKITRIQ